jgi:hypothetical protein
MVASAGAMPICVGCVQRAGEQVSAFAFVVKRKLVIGLVPAASVLEADGDPTRAP